MKKLIYFLFVLSLCLSSCKKQSTTWNSEYAVPLVYTTLDIGDMINDSNLVVNSDSTIDLLIEREIYRLKIDSLFSTPDTTISEMYQVPFPGTISVSPGFTFLSEAEESTFNITGAELKYIALKGGQLNYEIISYVTGPTIDSIIIPSATKLGTTFSTVINLPPSDGTSPAIVNGSVDLTDYEFDLTGSDGLKYNTLISKVSATIDPTASSPTDISNSDSIRINVSFENIIPDKAIGYFGNENVNVPLDSTMIPFMDRIIDGTIDLDQVDLDLSITNGIGVDIQSTISQLNSISGSSTVTMSHSSIGSPINLSRPSRTGWVINSSIFTASYNSSTSNLEAFIENLPDEISYAAQFQINPFGDVNSHGDFFSSEYPLKANISLDIPLCFAAGNLTLQDTIRMEIDQDTSRMKGGTLLIDAVNSFPFGAELQVYLLNEASGFTDSIVTQPVIAPAVVNALNEVISPTSSQVSLSLDADQMYQLIQSGMLLTKVIFNTTNQPDMIKVKDWHKIDLRVGTTITYQHIVN